MLETKDSEIHEPVTLMNAKVIRYPVNRTGADVAATKDTELQNTPIKYKKERHNRSFCVM